MRELRMSGSVRGVPSKGHPYRDHCRPVSNLATRRNDSRVGWPLLGTPRTIRTCAIHASGSYLGCLTSKRSLGQG